MLPHYKKLEHLELLNFHIIPSVYVKYLNALEALRFYKIAGPYCYFGMGNPQRSFGQILQERPQLVIEVYGLESELSHTRGSARLSLSGTELKVETT